MLFRSRHLHDSGVEMHTGVTVLHRTEDGIAGHTEYEDHWALPVDDLVLVTHQVPDDGLHQALLAEQPRWKEAGIEAVHLIGDAQSPRWISEAVFDGHRLARELELPDPSFPAPVLRDLPA